MPSPVTSSRALDHVVLPVAALGVARNRLTVLGFTVADDARHPFGTENACVYLAEGAYLEPLAVYDPEKCCAAIAGGNVFVARNENFRRQRGEGVSAIIAESHDAEVDHARFIDEGLSAGDMLRFERPVINADGTEALAGFKLAFAAHSGSPEFFLFATQRLLPMEIDRARLTRHTNGAVKVSAVVLAAAHPLEFEAYISTVFASPAVSSEEGDLVFDASGTDLHLLTPQRAFERFGCVAAADMAGLSSVGLVFAVTDLEVTRRHLDANGITHEVRERRLVVGPAAGQGVTFIFEEAA